MILKEIDLKLISTKLPFFIIKYKNNNKIEKIVILMKVLICVSDKKAFLSP